MQREMIIAGLGGQGLVVTSTLLAHAANSENKTAVQFSAYIGLIRGSRCECTVIVDTDGGPILGPPLVDSQAAVMAMHPESLQDHEKDVKPGGLLFVNTSLVTKKPSRSDVVLIEIPATQMAEQLGSAMAASMLALGAFVELTKIVQLSSVVKNLDKVIPPYRQKLIPINERALVTGAEFVRDHKGAVTSPVGVRAIQWC